MNQRFLQKLVDMESFVVPTLFKPGQFAILKKLTTGRPLTENEKRYLRGRMKLKLELLMRLLTSEKERTDDYILFLQSLHSYYITGLEALKHNGFGWYFVPKIIEVITTQIDGKINIADKTLRFIRVKSIKNSIYSFDEKTGLNYAANEQIIKDLKIIKNTYAESVCRQMQSRYGKLFVENI